MGADIGVKVVVDHSMADGSIAVVVVMLWVGERILVVAADNARMSWPCSRCTAFEHGLMRGEER